MTLMRFAVLVSGQGTNLQALLDAEAAGDLTPAEIVVVASNKPHAYGLERATAVGKPTLAVDHKQYETRQDFETALLRGLSEFRVDAIVLAGFMRILTESFLSEFPGRIINTHPSLLPAFPGTHAARQALEHGAKVSGCTVHFVDSGVDTGPIILQASVPVLDNDNEATLQQRIQREEHRLLPTATRLLALGRLSRDGRRIRTH